MNITIIGAGNSGIAMSAHLSLAGHRVTLWNRTQKNIAKLMETHTIYSKGAVEGVAQVHKVTSDLEAALTEPDIIFITTPANSHKNLAENIGKHLKKETLIVLNPGRTFGALEFERIYKQYNKDYEPIIAETQTIIYTCRKTAEDAVDVISLKSDVLISTFDASLNEDLIAQLPEVLQEFLIPAESMIETSLGNVGMILHCAPLLLNTGWTENPTVNYKYYLEGITPTISRFIEKVDQERVEVSKLLGLQVETTKEWLERTYHLPVATNLYESIQQNKNYLTINAPKSLEHRYIFEDVPCGLVPLEAMGRTLGLAMPATSLVVDMASILMETDFRARGRNLDFILKDHTLDNVQNIFKRRDS